MVAPGGGLLSLRACETFAAVTRGGRPSSPYRHLRGRNPGAAFVLGTGLHSYGFGSGDHTAVSLVGLLNLSLVVHASLRYLRRQAA